MASRGTEMSEREQAMALAHAPAAARPALAALLMLDAALGRVLRTTREPLVGQMRLAWWREALTALDDAAPPAEPVLVAVSRDLLPRGGGGAALATMVDGWEALLRDPLDDGALMAFAAARGGTLFTIAAVALGASGAGVAVAGEGWALADLALHLSDPATAQRARSLAAARFASGFATRWPAPVRPLGALALLARANLDGIGSDSPRRAVRLAWHRLTGR